MNFKEEYQNHNTEELLKIILENNNSYTKDALLDIIELLKQRGNTSKLILGNYSAEKLVELILTKKDYIPEIKEILDTFFKENPNKFEEIIKSEKQSSGEVNLIISGAKVIDTKRDLIGNIFVTDKNIYFITTKISNLPENLAFFYGAGGVLFGLIGEVINKLTNKPKTFEKTDDIPLNILTKYIDGSFKIDLSNILLVRINNKNNHFVFKTKDNNQWSYHFFTNSEDREKIREIFHKYNINVEPAKGFFKTLIEAYKEKKK